METRYITKEIFNDYKKRFSSTIEELEFVESYMHGKDIELKIGNGPRSIFMVPELEYPSWKKFAENMHRIYTIVETKFSDSSYLETSYHRKHYKEI